MKSIFLGAELNGEHTLRDWHCSITNSDVISMPSPNLSLLEVPGMSGRLDVSEALTGDVSYGNRTLKLELAKLTYVEDWYSVGLHVFNAFHGRKVKVIFDDDPDHYYLGRAVVSDPKRIQTAGTLTITIDADPFRYNIQETVVPLTGQSEVIEAEIQNDRMPTIPTINVPNGCELIYEGISYNLTAGDNVIPGCVFTEGSNEFTIRGATTATVRFREGCL